MDQSAVREEPESRSHSHAWNWLTADATPVSLVAYGSGWIWLTVAGLLSIRLVVRWFRVRQMLSTCEPITDVRLQDVFCNVCSERNMVARPTLLSTSGTVSPMVAGALRPAIVMPEDASDWTEMELQMVFTHELGHVARRDILIQLLGDFACAVNWFNPLAWFASTRMRSLREFACDDLVVTRYRQPADYADVLLKIAKACRQQSPAMTMSMARMSSISQRLLSVVDGSAERAALNRGATRMSSVVSMVLIGLLSVIELTATAQTPSELEQQKNADTFDSSSNEDSGLPEGVRTMRVRIVGDDGKPIAKASIIVDILDIERLDSTLNVTLETDDQGEVDIWLPKKLGHLRLRPSKPGYVPQLLNFGKPKQDEVEDLPGSQTFYLQRGVRLSGTVVDSTGQSIAGASVQVRVDAPGSRLMYESESRIDTWLARRDDAAVTDKDGRWEILNAPAKKDGADYEFLLRVTHPEFAGDMGWGGLQASQGVTTEQIRAGTARIKLDPGLRIRGKITGPNGEPVTQGFVIWDDKLYRAEGNNEAAIDETGSYQSLPLSPNQYRVAVLAPGFAPQQVDFKLDSSTPNLNFSLKTGNPLTSPYKTLFVTNAKTSLVVKFRDNNALRVQSPFWSVADRV